MLVSGGTCEAMKQIFTVLITDPLGLGKIRTKRSNLFLVIID